MPTARRPCNRGATDSAVRDLDVSHPRSLFLALLTRLLATARRRLLLESLLLFVAVWFASAWLILWFEQGHNPRVTDLLHANYQLLVTMTTSGDAAVAPLTTGGRVVMGFALVLSKLVTALMCALAAAIFVERKVKEEMGLSMHKLDNHLVIIGWNMKGPRIISTMRAEPDGAHKPIVVVVDSDSKPVEDPLVFFARSTLPIRGEAMERASLSKAATVVVLANYDERTHADALTAVNCLQVRSENPTARIIVELLDPSQRCFMEAAGADEVVGIGEVGGYLLAEAAMGSAEARRLLQSVASSAARRSSKPAAPAATQARPPRVTPGATASAPAHTLPSEGPAATQTASTATAHPPPAAEREARREKQSAARQSDPRVTRA